MSWYSSKNIQKLKYPNEFDALPTPQESILWWWILVHLVYNRPKKSSNKMRWCKQKLTSHSRWPWKPSWLSRFTAITMPVPGLVGAKVCSSIHPLNTVPKPPSPNILSGRKFLVAIFSSLKVKFFKFEDCKISPSVRTLCGAEPDETWVLELLDLFPSFLPNHKAAATGC